MFADIKGQVPVALLLGTQYPSNKVIAEPPEHTSFLDGKIEETLSSENNNKHRYNFSKLCLISILYWNYLLLLVSSYYFFL